MILLCVCVSEEIPGRNPEEITKDNVGGNTEETYKHRWKNHWVSFCKASEFLKKNFGGIPGGNSGVFSGVNLENNSDCFGISSGNYYCSLFCRFLC